MSGKDLSKGPRAFPQRRKFKSSGTKNSKLKNMPKGSVDGLSEVPSTRRVGTAC
jgi:hypothetical protein